jgi:hypothetical protein
MNGVLKGQYPFEKYPAISYKDFADWKMNNKSSKKKNVSHTITIQNFDDNNDSITIQLTSLVDNWESSYISIFRNKKQIQKLLEPEGFFLEGYFFDPIRTADINGDGLTDIKILIRMGGLSTLNYRVIYLFQKPNGKFTKISFEDLFFDNRPERDFDGDNNYEIIIMTLFIDEKSHWYSVYSLFELNENDFINVNSKHDYPIVIDFDSFENCKITDEMSRQVRFSPPKPDKYDKK